MLCGNLASRVDQSGNKNLSETFGYDGLNRLTSHQVAGQSAKTVTYNSIGNITSKTGVGSYSYGAGNAGPHAVTDAGGVTYSYDANGNNTSSSDGRSISYTVFNKADSVTKGTHTTAFTYGPERSRYKRTDNNGSGTRTTLYIGSVEKITHIDGSKEVKRYIGGVIIETEDYASNGAFTGEEQHFTFKDHLGSMDVITDNTGSILTNGGELSFDPWGQRRSGVNWNDVNISQLIADYGVFSSIAPVTTRGFTGHEMADEVGIIHMNGRIYDPRLGRFLQADPFVQSPTNTQSLNRYSYGFNNPLNGTDPSGYLFGIDDFIISWIFYNVIVPSAVAYAIDFVANGGIQDLLSSDFSAQINGVSEGAFSGQASPGSLSDLGEFGELDIILGDISSPFDFEDTLVARMQQAVLARKDSNITGYKFENAATSESFIKSLSLNITDLNTHEDERRESRATRSLSVNLAGLDMPETVMKGERRPVHRNATNNILIYGERRAASKKGVCSATDDCIDKFEEINNRNPDPILPERGGRKGKIRVKPGHPVKIITEEVLFDQVEKNRIQEICEIMNEDFCNDPGEKPWLP